MVSLAVALYSSASVPFFLLVDADPCDFDPRPGLSRLVRSEVVYPLWREWDNARHTCREFGRDAAALALLLTTSPKGAQS